jgi:hypothetical protein
VSIAAAQPELDRQARAKKRYHPLFDKSAHFNRRVCLCIAAARPKADRSAAAKKAAETRKRKAAEAGAGSKKKAAAK